MVMGHFKIHYRPKMSPDMGQKALGYLIYYLSFAGHVHSLIDRVITRGIGHYYLFVVPLQSTMGFTLCFIKFSHIY